MSQHTILVVDDSPSARLVTRRLLEGCGYRVEEAGAAEIALRVIPVLRPDAVVMDNLMPGMDGCDAALELASSTLTSSIPVVLVSAGVDEGLERRARSFGVRAVVRKGDDPRQLCRLLDDLLSARSIPLHAEAPAPQPDPAPSDADVWAGDAARRVAETLAGVLAEQLPTLMRRHLQQALAASEAALRADLERLSGDLATQLTSRLQEGLAPQLGGLVRATLEQAAQRQARALEAGLLDLLGGVRARPESARRARH